MTDYPCAACHGSGAAVTPALVALDAADEVLAAARHVRAVQSDLVGPQPIAWWHAVGELLRAVDAMGEVR